MKTETVTHNGQDYTFPLDDKDWQENIKLEMERDHYDGGDLVYDYELSGAHEGPPIQVSVYNPKFEDDEGSTYYTFDKCVWTDDRDDLEAIIGDTYFEAIKDDIKEIINETWY